MSKSSPASARGREMLRLLRPHQWAKNTLLFLPLLLAHQFGDSDAWIATLLGFALFSMIASGVYALNDYRDIEADRLHPTKKNRPLATGSLRPRHALIMSAVLGPSGLVLSFTFLPRGFTALLIGYVSANVLYTFWLKRIPVLDVLVLTLMYVVRIQAGGLVAGVVVTDWLLMFSLFLFLSLALGKRFQELRQARTGGALDDREVRGYRVGDQEIVAVCGVSAGLASVLVLALYVHRGSGIELYRSPALLWLLCPLVLYWITRFWILNARRRMQDDPVAFALRDPVSYLVGLLLASVLVAAHAVDLPF